MEDKEQPYRVIFEAASDGMIISDIETGRVVLSGTAADIKRDDNVRRSYLGY